ncbi:crossover junction endonuclease EME1-like isoform X2 [Daphnia carinata]|uniref:crossover junction endonuclease EME1-like isoform X2 n=1 Tax=Daphnia carinata TaxID=120202 RepID=UPI002868A930|nr:crossover junction endonuclease EME1-like isoform X2 [Daphnia carinata]
MASEIVVLSSDSEDDVEFRGESPGKTPSSAIHQPSDSDEEFMNLDLGSPLCQKQSKNFDFMILETIPETSSRRIPANDLIQTYATRPYSTTENICLSNMCPLPSDGTSCNNQPGKKVTKTKQAKAYDKACKAAEAANKKSNRTSDCLKNVTTLIDSHLLDAIPNSGNILTQLQQSEMKHSITVSPIPNSVCWKREKINYHVAEDAICSTSTTVHEDDGLIVLMAEQFFILGQSSICDYVAKVLKSLNKQTLTLVVYGIAAYWKGKARKDKRRFRDRVSTSTETSKKTDYPSDDDIGFTPADLEILKVKLVLQTECSLWPVETAEELGTVITRITKAVAERPFKEERLEQTFDFYAADVSGNVKVSKDGHGLERLWQQQLMQFPLVALETSQAIASRYHSPQALIQAYKMCKNDKEASLLLQDIPIRRHAGPLSTSRKVGPELSKKIYRFFNGKDGFTIL